MDFLLLAAYVVGTFVAIPSANIYRLINLDAEAALGAWWSSSQLLLTGVMFAVAAYVRRSQWMTAAFYAVCALAFVFLSADEAASIHEKITLAVRGIDYWPKFAGGHGAWIPLYLAAAAVFGIATAKFWIELWQTRRRGVALLFIGAATFVLGAVILEIASYGGLREAASRQYYAYQVLVEEAFELIGVSVMLIGAICICGEPDGSRSG